MIEPSSFINSINDWYKDQYAVPSIDALLCAFVKLRLIGTGTFDLLDSRRQLFTSKSLTGMHDIIQNLNRTIDEWQSQWLPLFTADGMMLLLVLYSVQY